MNPPDNATEIFRWFCNTTCLANYSTGQPRPMKAKAPVRSGLFE